MLSKKMILITKIFEKILYKIKSIQINEIKVEIDKHKSLLDNFVEI